MAPDASLLARLSVVRDQLDEICAARWHERVEPVDRGLYERLCEEEADLIAQLHEALASVGT